MLRSRRLTWALLSCTLLMSGCGWTLVNTHATPCNRNDVSEHEGRVVITQQCWNWILLQLDSYKKGQGPR